MNNEKVSQFVITLIKLTTAGEIVWKSYAPHSNELLNGEVVLDKMYRTDLKGKRFQLYRYKFKIYLDEYLYEWSQRIRLELIDLNALPEYEFEYDNSMNDLYDIVREKTSNVNDIVDDILGLKLEIIEAIYFTSDHSLDVTSQVKGSVKNNTLSLMVTNEIGGEDPDPGVVKHLKIKYSFDGETKEKEVQEGQTVKLP